MIRRLDFFAARKHNKEITTKETNAEQSRN